MTELVIFVKLFGDRCPCYKKQIGTNWVPLLASWQERATIALFRKLHINRKGTPVLDVPDLSCCYLFFVCFRNLRHGNIECGNFYQHSFSHLPPIYTNTHSLMTMENSLKNSMLMTDLLFCSSEILNERFGPVTHYDQVISCQWAGLYFFICVFIVLVSRLAHSRCWINMC